MKSLRKQLGYIDIPGWWFAMVPIGVILIIVELIRIGYWIYENVEVSMK